MAHAVRWRLQAVRPTLAPTPNPNPNPNPPSPLPLPLAQALTRIFTQALPRILTQTRTRIFTQTRTLTVALTLTRCIGSYDPDMVVSLHPLCQNLPLKVSVRVRV